MVNNFYTLRALVEEWAPDLEGCTLADAFSQVRDELTLAFASPKNEWMIRISTRAPFLYMFRAEGYNRARRNVATLFEEAFDQNVKGIRIAERDRIVFFDLSDDRCLEIVLFGPRANVFLTRADKTVLEAFQSDADWTGRAAPEPRPAPRIETAEQFKMRWRADQKTLEQALASAFPLFNRTLAAEVIYRAGISAKKPADCTSSDLHALFETSRSLAAELSHPAPHIYWRNEQPDTFALVPLEHKAELKAESFDTVDAAVRIFVRRSLATQRFRETYEPLRRSLAEAVEHYHHRAERMLEELSKESRADRYERWGHLLMATATDVPAGSEEIEVPDLFSEGQPVTIPLDPSLSPVENARQYYDRARRTRQSRAHAEDRLLEAEERARLAGLLLEKLESISSFNELEQFRKELLSREDTARFIRTERGEETRFPFRRFPLGEGYEVWVGKNAKQNDLLTFKYAQKYDRWMHARGVAGSHVVLRLPHRHANPGSHILERAASIAAYFSKAQGSIFVPVTVSERKYVRKPKGAPPGSVLVEREEVLIVEPRLPTAEIET